MYFSTLRRLNSWSWEIPDIREAVILIWWIMFAKWGGDNMFDVTSRDRVFTVVWRPSWVCDWNLTLGHCLTLPTYQHLHRVWLHSATTESPELCICHLPSARDAGARPHSQRASYTQNSGTTLADKKRPFQFRSLSTESTQSCNLRQRQPTKYWLHWTHYCYHTNSAE